MKTMKNILIAIAASALIMPVFNSCKKGENDPMISLKSRDSRMAGEWTLSKIEQTKTTDAKGNTINSTTYSNTLTTETTTFDGATKTWVEKKDYSGNPVPTTTSETTTKVYAETVDITLDKHGIAKATVTTTYKSKTLATTPANACGTFGTPGVSCDGVYTVTTPTTSTMTYEGTWSWANNKKNKEAITLNLGALISGTYMVDQLKSKETVLIQSSVDNSVNSGGDNSSNSVTDKAVWTLTAK